MRKEFKFHRLNEYGIDKARKLAELYNTLCEQVTEIVRVSSPELTIATRKLEESCFYAKKAMAEQDINQDIPTAQG